MPLYSAPGAFQIPGDTNIPDAPVPPGQPVDLSPRLGLPPPLPRHELPLNPEIRSQQHSNLSADPALIYADGSRSQTLHEIGGQEDWSSLSNFWDAEGHLWQQIWYRDDRSRDIFTFDQSNISPNFLVHDRFVPGELPHQLLQDFSVTFNDAGTHLVLDFD